MPRLHSFQRAGALLFAIVLGVSAIDRVDASAVLPDTASTRQFVIGLQRDFAERQSRAILDRVDSDAMLERIVGTGADDPQRPRLNWARSIQPALENVLSVFNQYPQMVAGRVILADGAREFEGQFVDANSAALVAEFTLVQSPYGTVRISDLRIQGDTLPFSRMLHQELQLLGVAMPMVDGDDAALRAFGASYSDKVQSYFREMHNDRAWAYSKLWASLPDDLKQMAIWKYFRNGAACAGVKAARTDVIGDIRAGGDNDPFVCLWAADWQNDFPAQLQAVDAILAARQEPVIYRCVKATLLYKLKRYDEAYNLFRDIVDLDPMTVTAYRGGVVAAVEAHRYPAAVAMLKRWTLMESARAIDGRLAQEAGLKDFRQTEEYQAWLAFAPAKLTLLGR